MKEKFFNKIWNSFPKTWRKYIALFLIFPIVLVIFHPQPLFNFIGDVVFGKKIVQNINLSTSSPKLIWLVEHALNINNGDKGLAHYFKLAIDHESDVMKIRLWDGEKIIDETQVYGHQYSIFQDVRGTFKVYSVNFYTANKLSDKNLSLDVIPVS